MPPPIWNNNRNFVSDKLELMVDALIHIDNTWVAHDQQSQLASHRVELTSDRIWNRTRGESRLLSQSDFQNHMVGVAPKPGRNRTGPVKTFEQPR